MLNPALIRSSTLRQLNHSPGKRRFLVFYKGLVCREYNFLSLPGIASNLLPFGCIRSLRQFLRGFRTWTSNYSWGPRLELLLYGHCANRRFEYVRYASSVGSIALDSGGDVVRFDFGEDLCRNARLKGGEKGTKRVKMSKKAKRNELRFFRLKARKKINSPNPEVRIRYKLGKAKRKEVWLIEKLRKFEVPKAPAERYDPEILTEEEKHYLKRTGEKKKNYVQVGRRGLFGGVVLNMHLHWKRHETVKVICRPCKPGKIHEYAEELARLSKGIVIDVKPNNTIIFYRGKNYVQPKVMSPPDTLSKQKALEKYKYEQSLEHTSQFIEKLENELEEYYKYKERKEGASSISSDST